MRLIIVTFLSRGSRVSFSADRQAVSTGFRPPQGPAITGGSSARRRDVRPPRLALSESASRSSGEPGRDSRAPSPVRQAPRGKGFQGSLVGLAPDYIVPANRRSSRSGDARLAGALYHFSMWRTSVRLSRCSWSGASSSIFHSAACASPSVPYSVRSTVPSSSNSTRAQLN
jgi:hypothetical protein